MGSSLFTVGRYLLGFPLRPCGRPPWDAEAVPAGRPAASGRPGSRGESLCI